MWISLSGSDHRLSKELKSGIWSGQLICMYILSHSFCSIHAQVLTCIRGDHVWDKIFWYWRCHPMGAVHLCMFILGNVQLLQTFEMVFITVLIVLNGICIMHYALSIIHYMVYTQNIRTSLYSVKIKGYIFLLIVS